MIVAKPSLWQACVDEQIVTYVDLLILIDQIHQLTLIERFEANDFFETSLIIIQMMLFFFAGVFHFFVTESCQNVLFRHNRFYTLFFSMKMVESGKIVFVSCIIDFKEVQVWWKVFTLNLNTYGVMMGFFKIWPEKSRTPS